MKKLILKCIFATSLCAANAYSLDTLLEAMEKEFNKEEMKQLRDTFGPAFSDIEKRDEVSMVGVEESIKSLLPRIQSYAIYVNGLRALSKEDDPDAVRHFKQIVRGLNDNKVNESIRRQSTSTVSFLKFIESSLNNFLSTYENTPKSEAFDALASEYLWTLWQEINESADKTAADLTALMALEWKMSDSNWEVTNASVGHVIKYRGLKTDAIKAKLSLLVLIDQDHREYTKFAQAMDQENFDKFFRTLGVSLYYDELMLYQNILEVLSRYIDMDLKTSTFSKTMTQSGSKGKEILISMQGISEPQDYLGLLSHYCSKSNNKKPLIDSIFKLKSPSAIESVCQIKLTAMLKELQHALPDDLAKKKIKGDKKKAKRLRQKARGSKADTSLEEVLLESDDDLSPSKTPLVDTIKPVKPEQKEPSVKNEALSPSKTSLPAVSMKPVKPEQKESAAEARFTGSTFSDVIINHARGTVNANDFKEFLGSIGGRMDTPRRNGMTRYYLPKANNRQQEMYFHVHLPHGPSDPFYPAILHHFIRPSIQAAGYTAEMFE